MTTTFSRRIKQVYGRDIPGFSSAAYAVDWRVECNEDPSIASWGTFNLGPPNRTNFVPFASITEDNAKGWIGASFWENCETVLKARRAQKQADTEVNKTF